MVDADIIAALIAAGEGYLDDVRRFREEAGREQFLADRGAQYKVEFPLQQAIQVGIDLAAHALADTPGSRPSTLAGLFAVLADRGRIDADLAVRLSTMARFRNLLVHRYAEIDAARVWIIVTDHLGDLDDLLRVAAGWTAAGPDER